MMEDLFQLKFFTITYKYKHCLDNESYLSVNAGGLKGQIIPAQGNALGIRAI
jgi:hypothetical protein